MMFKDDFFSLNGSLNQIHDNEPILTKFVNHLWLSPGPVKVLWPWQLCHWIKLFGLIKSLFAPEICWSSVVNIWAFTCTMAGTLKWSVKQNELKQFYLKMRFLTMKTHEWSFFDLPKVSKVLTLGLLAPFMYSTTS